MANNIKFNSIGAAQLETLSGWNVAEAQLAILKAEHKKNKDALNNELESLRSEDVIMSDAERLSEIERVLDAIADCDAKYRDDCKPYRAASRKGYAFVDDTMFAAYVVAVDRASVTATGTARVTRKNGKVDTYKADKSLATLTAEFLKSLGIEGGSEQKINDFAIGIVALIGAKLGDVSQMEYLVAKNESPFKGAYIRSFMHFAVRVRHALDINDDYTVVLHDYSNEE